MTLQERMRNALGDLSMNLMQQMEALDLAKARIAELEAKVAELEAQAQPMGEAK